MCRVTNLPSHSWPLDKHSRNEREQNHLICSNAKAEGDFVIMLFAICLSALRVKKMSSIPLLYRREYGVDIFSWVLALHPLSTSLSSLHSYHTTVQLANVTHFSQRRYHITLHYMYIKSCFFCSYVTLVSSRRSTFLSCNIYGHFTCHDMAKCDYNW